jgi:hypothetical protein
MVSNDFFFNDEELNGFFLNDEALNDSFFNNEELNDFFFNNKELFPLLQELEQPIEAALTECGSFCDAGIFDDISLEDDLSNPKHFFSLLEYVDMCAVLQMIIAYLE